MLPSEDMLSPIPRDLDNKAFVLLAFDTLFKKREYARTEAFWSQRYIQHRCG